MAEILSRTGATGGPLIGTRGSMIMRAEWRRSERLMVVHSHTDP